MTGRKKIDSKWLVLGCIVVALCIIIAGVAVLLDGDLLPAPDQTPSAQMTPGNSDPASQTVPGESAAEGQTAAVVGGETASAGAISSDPTTRPNQPNQPTSPAPRPTEPVIQAPVTIPQQQEAAYEHWLAAGMVIGISMEYPDFQLQGIYLTGRTELENKMDSKGAYILFTSGGKKMAIHSIPLAQERKISGTVDLSTQTIGFATFDTVDPASVNTAAMNAVEIGDLEELISQSLLVSLYWN